MTPWRQEQVAAHAHTEDNVSTTKRGGVEENSRGSSRLGAVILGLGTMAAVVLGLSFYLVNRDESLLQRDTSVHANFQGTISAASLAEHAVPTDCWLLIYGNVYDLTEYAPKHPGGRDYVTDFCGMDATRDYALEHPKSLLNTIPMYLLGTFVEASASVSEEEPTKDTQPVASPNPPAPAPGPAPAPTDQQLCQEQFFTSSDVAAHADSDDCWYILYNVVYDFTDYVSRHPGGSRRIFQECGTDATGAYANERKHDERLLVTEGMSKYIIGTFGTTSGLLSVPCQ
jgi:cytochrome b involved in lipid metabolism